MVLRQETVRDQHGAAALLEDRFDLRFGQRAAECGLALLDLRMQVFGQLRDDVVFLPLRQPELYCLQITFDQVHDPAPCLSKIAFIEQSMSRHSASRRSKISVPPAVSR